MIFHRALLREFAGLAGAVFMSLFSIAVTINLIRLLGKAAGGSIPTDAVLAFLGFFALGGDVGQPTQQQRRAGLAGKIGQRCAQRAARALVDAPRRRRQLLLGINAQHDAARLRRLGRERLYAKFHSESIA